MDIHKVVKAARRQWGVVLMGVLIGIVLIAATTLQVTGSSGDRHLAPRTKDVFEARTRLLITEPNLGVARMDQNQGWPDNFTKTVAMAPTYAYLLVSDAVKEGAAAETGPLRETIKAKAIDNTPVIELTVKGTDAERTTAVSRALSASLVAYLKAEQDRGKVPAQERVHVEVLSAAQTPGRASSSMVEVGALAFMTPLLISLGLAVSIENSRERRQVETHDSRFQSV